MPVSPSFLSQFRHTLAEEPWQAEIPAAAASHIGSYGVFGGKLIFHGAETVGRVTTFEDAGGSQGAFGATAILWMQPDGAAGKALRANTWFTVNGTCDKKAECRRWSTRTMDRASRDSA